jgi:hypothetical protein
MGRRHPAWHAVMVGLLTLALPQLPAAAAADGSTAAFDTAIRPLLKDYCLGCHSSAKHKGDFDLEQHVDGLDI